MYGRYAPAILILVRLQLHRRQAISSFNFLGVQFLSALAIFTFWVFTLWHITLVLYSKRKSRITAPVPLTTKLISKQARLNVTNSVLVPVKKNSLFRRRNLLFQLFCPRKWRYFFFLTLLFLFTPKIEPATVRLLESESTVLLFVCFL